MRVILGSGGQRPGRRLLWLIAAATAVTVLAVARPALADATLTPKPSSVTAGHMVSLVGSGFDQCTDPKTQSTAVMLSWIGVNISAVATGSSGDFIETQTVPVGTIPWTYQVIAQCYDASTGTTGPELTSTYVTVQGTCPDCQPSLLFPENVTAGSPATISGSGFPLCTQAQRPVELFWDGSPWSSGSVPDGSGDFSDTAVVPAQSAVGYHKVVAACTDQQTGVTIAGAGHAIRVVSVGPTATISASASASPTNDTSSTPVASRPATVPTKPVGSSSPGSALHGSSAGPPAGLIGGVTSGVIGVISVGLLVVRARRRSHPILWSPQQVRAEAAEVPRPPSVRTWARSGIPPVSLRLEPHADFAGSQQHTEADQ